jgi:hypothetical protein
MAARVPVPGGSATLAVSPEGTVASREKQLWREVSDLLGHMSGWSVQDSPTPGVDPVWCFATHGRVEYSVSTEGGALHFYEEKTDGEVQFESVEALTDWLTQHRPATLEPRQNEARQPLMRWR